MSNLPHNSIPRNSSVDQSPIDSVATDIKARGRTNIVIKSMNQTEQRFAAFLDLRMRLPADDPLRVVWWWLKPFSLRLGPDCHLEIDFMVLEPSGLVVCYDTKGAKKQTRKDKLTGATYQTGATIPYIREDARVKMAAAAEIYFLFDWRVTWETSPGNWAEKTILKTKEMK